MDERFLRAQDAPDNFQVTATSAVAGKKREQRSFN